METQPIVTIDILPDQELIGRIIRGEKNLYAVLMRRYNQRMYRIARSIIDDDSEIEDIMQAAYIHAYEHLPAFGFRSTFSTWLTKILINETLLRLKIKKKSVNMNDETTNHLFPDRNTPLRSVMNTELRTIIETSVQQLPEKYRVVFVMREIEGMSTAETRECLDISEVNVKVRLNRAKSLLRDAISAFYKKDDILHFHLSRCDRVVGNVMQKIS